MFDSNLFDLTPLILNSVSQLLMITNSEINQFDLLRT